MGESTSNHLRLQEREEIQYLLGNAPGWMMRFGITAVAGLLALLLWLSYVLRYPDVVEAGVVLIMLRELALAEREYRRQQQLHAGGVISDKEWHSSEAAYLAQERQVESAEASILQNEMQIRQLESQVSELRRVKSERENDKSLTVAEDLQRMHSAIAEWKLRYLVTAPVSGQVSLYKVWSAQQSVAPGEELLAISPASSERVIGRAELQALQSGRVAVGQRASIRLDGYPAEQFGEIEASVVSVALLPCSDTYLVELSLPDTLRSTYGKLLPFKPEMSGVARIVTEERRVLDRILGQVRDLLRNR
ncbi:MAG: HlyD family efflux transporter periplasmic adaptor subunit [Saprospiraceae bacterium]|nr:HlyD family efflux transporter periplasmic adaptor subunit [Saprospiraceae bacterium]